MTDIQQRYWAQQETNRHNREVERLTGLQVQETQRSNMRREALTEQANAISALQAQTAQYNAVTQRSSVANQYALGLINASVAQQNVANTRYANETQRMKVSGENLVNVEQARKVSIDADYAKQQNISQISQQYATAADKGSSALNRVVDFFKKLF